MFEIKVVGFDEVQAEIDAGWPTRIISVIKKTNMPNYGDHHLHLTFDDVHNTNNNHIHPLMEHLQTVLNFTKDLTEDDRVLVHCLAGVSRSTATAIAICIQHGMSYQDAYNHIKMIRPVANPNRLITEYTDQHFGLGGELLKLVEESDPFPNLMLMATQAYDRLVERAKDEPNDS